MANRPCSLQGTQLSRSFGEGETLTVVLHELSLELAAGEFALIMGPSGSGKSTLLSVLSGLLHPDRGQVLALGEDIWEMSDRQRREFRLRHFGFIFQGYNLFPALTAQEQLEMVVRWGEGKSCGEAARRAGQMLDVLGLARKARLLPGQLSGGEKQRVAVGRALIKEPEFCFADEPTGALDWEHGKQVIELLSAAVRQRGATVLVVGHDARIAPYADRVFSLVDGYLTAPKPVAGPSP
jgi:putative ABC transport system ATP-binding protein